MTKKSASSTLKTSLSQFPKIFPKVFSTKLEGHQRIRNIPLIQIHYMRIYMGTN